MRLGVVGRVTHLQVTAIKGFGMADVDAVRVTPAGFDGNRRFCLLDETGRLFSVTRSSAFLPYSAVYDDETKQLTVGRGSHTAVQRQVTIGQAVRVPIYGERVVDGHYVDKQWDDWVSSVAGRALRLIYLSADAPRFDLHPVTLVGEASVRSLGSEDDGHVLDRRRFRMSMCLDLGPTPFFEEQWHGRTALVGDCRLTIGGRVPRCAGAQNNWVTGVLCWQPAIFDPAVFLRARSSESGGT
jgi:uncharacterized protein YcbX